MEDLVDFTSRVTARKAEVLQRIFERTVAVISSWVSVDLREKGFYGAGALLYIASWRPLGISLTKEMRDGMRIISFFSFGFTPLQSRHQTAEKDSHFVGEELR